MATPSTLLIEFLIGLDERELAPRLTEHAAMAVLNNVACGLYGSTGMGPDRDRLRSRRRRNGARDGV